MTSSSERVQAELSRIRETLVQRHGGVDQTAQTGSHTARSAIDRAASRARISAHWGITSELPVIGGVVVLVLRALRIGLRWYINPIVEQQNEFNDTVVRALYELQAEIDELRVSSESARHAGHE